MKNSAFFYSIDFPKKLKRVEVNNLLCYEETKDSFGILEAFLTKYKSEY